MALAALFASGCARFAYVALPPPTEEVAVSPQYRAQFLPGIPSATFEVYLQNTTAKPIVFTSAVLNEMRLPLVTAPEWEQATHGIEVEGVGTTAAPLSKVLWWQFYPSSNAAPGETVVAQVHFLEAPVKEQKLVVGDGDQRNYSISIPAYRPPDRCIRNVTYTHDYRRMFIQYPAGRPQPVRLWINSREVLTYSILKPGEGGAGDMLALDAPFKIAPGQPLHIKVAFNDGQTCQAMVRAMSGIMLDAYTLKDEKDRGRLRLDKVPAVDTVAGAQKGDVGCDDARQRRLGASVPEVVSGRMKALNDPATRNRLTAVHYCVVSHPLLVATYGPLADAALASPYSVSHGTAGVPIMENEERHMDWAAASVWPRPWLWIPDAFKGRDRFLEPEELDVMTWMALLKGCKGIKYFRAYSADGSGFEACPTLEQAIRKTNVRVREAGKTLAPLMPVEERLLDDGQRGTKLYIAWAGDRGVLLLLRNLAYETDDAADANSDRPRFRALPKTGISVVYRLPDWVNYRDVRDWRTGKKVDAVCDNHRRVHIRVQRLDGCALLWIGNGKEPWWRSFMG